VSGYLNCITPSLTVTLGSFNSGRESKFANGGNPAMFG
jgi:hypothetical protein